METTKHIKTAFGHLALRGTPKPGEAPHMQAPMKCWCCGSGSTELEYDAALCVFRCICGVEYQVDDAIRPRTFRFRQVMN